MIYFSYSLILFYDFPEAKFCSRVAIKVIKRQTNLILLSKYAKFPLVIKISLFTFKADQKSLDCFTQHVFEILCFIKILSETYFKKHTF